MMMVSAAAGLLGETLVLRHRIVLEDFVLENPDLNAASAVATP
jgi:ApbE superfamily uncharacterized protein (UPF0280 family)